MDRVSGREKQEALCVLEAASRLILQKEEIEARELGSPVLADLKSLEKFGPWRKEQVGD